MENLLKIITTKLLINKMSKQTATEWLFKKLWDEPKDKLTWYAILNQAEEMFEEQIIDSWDNGYDRGFGFTDAKFDSSEQYYNKTFNK
jgi:hypothetical protein